MMVLLRSAAILPLVFFSMVGAAQCPAIVDITSRQNDKVEVWIRPQSYFGGYFAAMSFTVRWFMADGADLGGVEMQVPYFGLAPSGPAVVDGIYKYQRYAGFATTLDTLGSASLNASWQPEEEILLARITMIGVSNFQIIEDEWTNMVENNANYYISLNGNDCQGEIYTFSTDLAAAGSVPTAVSIAPNPSSGISTISVDLQDPADLHFELLDLTGKLIWQESRSDRMGRYNEQLDLQGYSNGVYFLNVQIGESKSTHRIILASGKL